MYISDVEDINIDISNTYMFYHCCGTKQTGNFLVKHEKFGWAQSFCQDAFPRQEQDN